MHRQRSSIFSFETLAFRGDGWRSALTAIVAGIAVCTAVEGISRAALDPVGRYWEYPRTEMAITYEWFRSESADEGFDLAIAGDSTAARNINPQLLSERLGDDSQACNLGWPANFPLSFQRLTLPVLQSAATAPRVLVLSFSPLGFVETPLARQFEAGLLSSPICRRQEQGWLVADVVRVARWRAALPWRRLWFSGASESMIPEAGGFLPVDGTWKGPDSDDEQRRAEALAEVTWTVDENRFRVLRETAEWARDRGTTLYVIVPPRIDPGEERRSVETEYLAMLACLSNELGVRVLDLRESRQLSRNHFRDAGHLNRTGADRFTRHLARIVASGDQREIAVSAD